MTEPRALRLRKAMFQIHLWIGLAVGLYIVMLSVTGSALVFRREMDRAFQAPRPTFDPARRILSKDELRAAAERAYPGFTIDRMGDRVTRRNPVIEIALVRGSETRNRVFNPYTGEDLGDAFPWGSRALIWLASLHDDLLFGDRGRYWNGVGSILATVLCLTGAVVWWPGIRAWRRAVKVKWDAAWPRLNFDVHSAMGFWFFGILLLWSFTGVYLGIPDPFERMVDALSDPDAILGERPLDYVFRWLTRLHFGRWDSKTLEAAWVVMGLTPAIMFVTGAVMWWQRVVRKKNVAPVDVESQKANRTARAVGFAIAFAVLAAGWLL